MFPSLVANRTPFNGELSLMGNFTISPTEVLTVIGGAAAIVTAMWHAAMNIGKLTVKVDRHEDRLNDHEDQLDHHKERLDRYVGTSGTIR